ncbi:MAG: hypothetical protein Cons2KO_10830 [Congregibacter sp.]
MFSTATTDQSSIKGLRDRQRAIALWVGGLGFTINALGFLAVYLLGDASPLLIAECATYAVVFVTIALCAYRDFFVREVLFGGLIAIYVVFWAGAFALALSGEVMLLSLPLTLFVPLLVTFALPHRALFAIAPIHFAAVFLYTSAHVLPVMGVSWTVMEQSALSLGLAGFSSSTMVAFAVIAIARRNADTQLIELINEKERIASIDSLTELPNRRAFMTQLESHWPPAEPIAIAFIDLDHFKPLNDQYGHAMGDFVLRQVASRLKGISGAIAVTRLGGDEFAVCCKNTQKLGSPEAVAAEIHNRIAAEFQTEIGPISMGASVGYAVYDESIDSLSRLLRAADAAMRRAKATRSGWATFNHRIDSEALSSTSIEFELKSAVRSGHIRAAIQPIARAKDLEVVEYELLARWVESGFDRDPGPAEFIPIAEKLGMLNEILWVTLEEALSTLDLGDRSLAINVSPAQLLASDFLDTLLNILAKHRVHPSSITLEITEEVVYRNLDRNVMVLERAREEGISIALDDFGSGYSSLAMLDALPLDKLKIDQSLIKKALGNPRSENILAAAINLARQLELTACVEGLESEKALNKVISMGADLVQGYWLGKPKLLQPETKASLKLVS